ncbi:MAG: DUF262 domain-containing protein [Planctomycetes bacterium]|nr:DUF262 domain-containing protein [Planctomycetota bacterium]
MRDAQKPDHVSLNTLLGRLREGRYVIPDFQREFEWKPWDIRELMRSIFLDYYVGSLLLWKGKPESFEALSCEPIYGHAGKSEPSYIVLDGQQRLTAMYYAFVAPDVNAPSRKNRYLYFIHVDRFMDGEYEEAFIYDWTRSGVNLLEDLESQFAGHLFPLSVVGQEGWALANWVQKYEQHWQESASASRDAGDELAASDAEKHAERASAFGKHLQSLCERYQISYVELDQELELEKVCDIFTQINSRGVKLDVFDLINALLKPKGLQLKHMWRKAAPRFEFVEKASMNVYVLQVMSILRQAYCSPKYLYYLLPGQERTLRGADGSLHNEVLVPDAADFKSRWQDAVDVLDEAVKLLRHPQEFGAIAASYLPYISILPAFASLLATVRALPSSRQLDAQRKLRHWYWASVFTVRYSGSVESTTSRDYLDVKLWFEDDDVEPGLIAEFAARFRSLDLRGEVKRGTSVYNGIFNLLVLGKACDWATGAAPQHDDLDDHHIVPKSWGQKQKLGKAIDTILNRTPLTAGTNRKVIRDRLPNAYLPELIEANGESLVRATLESHCISPAAFDILMRDPFGPGDYEAFLVERQRTLMEAIEDLLVKERLGLPPQLRELDVQIEQVELALRRLVDQVLSGSPEELPPHVALKIQGRLQAAAKKNAAFDEAKYSSLAGILEFADLRELQDVITSKALWSRFCSAIELNATKESLAGRFDQLAELRNGIRHSRTVSDVARKDGEAALAWFGQVLEKAQGVGS